MQIIRSSRDKDVLWQIGVTNQTLINAQSVWTADNIWHTNEKTNQLEWTSADCKYQKIIYKRDLGEKEDVLLTFGRSKTYYLENSLLVLKRCWDYKQALKKQRSQKETYLTHIVHTYCLTTATFNKCSWECFSDVFNTIIFFISLLVSSFRYNSSM